MTGIHTFFDDIHISETSVRTSLMEPYLLVDFLRILQRCKILYLQFFWCLKLNYIRYSIPIFWKFWCNYLSIKNK